MTDDQEIEEELDVEAFAKANPSDCRKPHAKIYIIRIDREYLRVPEPELAGKEILRLAGKTPETHKLFQKHRKGESTPVEPDQVVSFVAPGVERFMTIPCDTTEG